MTVKIVEEWHYSNEAGYEVELPDGTRLVFSAELCDCRDESAYIKAEFGEYDPADVGRDSKRAVQLGETSL